MKQYQRYLIAGLGVTALLGLTGCSAISTEPDQVALHYSGGPMSSKNFQNCVASGTRETNGPGDGYYTYPKSQRSYEASPNSTAEIGSILVVSKDNVELSAPVIVTFTMNTSCEKFDYNGKTYSGGMLQLFHETLGNRYSAYWNADEEGDARADNVPKAWVSFLNFAIGTPLDTTYDRVAQTENWKDLWNNPETKVKVETKLSESLQLMVDQQTAAPSILDPTTKVAAVRHFFTISKVTVGKPDPTNEALKKAVADEQASVSRAQSAEAQAKADKTAAEAQIAVAQAKAASLKAERDVLGADWILKYGIDKGISPWPAPVVAGSAKAS